MCLQAAHIVRPCAAGVKQAFALGTVLGIELETAQSGYASDAAAYVGNDEKSRSPAG